MKLCTIVLSALFILVYVSPFVHPNTWWGWSFLGLLYPIILLLGCGFLCYWIVKRSWKWLLVMLFIISFGWSYMFRFIAYSGKPNIPPETNSLKVLSNNVQIFNLYDKNSETKFATRDSIFQYVIEQNPDVVCFQEFYVKDQPTTFFTSSLFESQFSALDRHQRYIYKEIGRQYFGIVMFSKFPMITKGNLSLPVDNSSNHNFCIFADIVKNKDTFRIYNVHLQSFKISFLQDDKLNSKWVNGAIERLKTSYPQRADQAMRIMEHIQKSPYPVIICGDFNDTPVSFVYQEFNRTLTDAFLNAGSGFGVTYAGNIPAGRIDYIFHSPELKSYDFQIQQKHFSDHKAISCVIGK